MGWKGKKPTSFSLDVSKAAEDKVKKITMETVQSLMMGSPVDEGGYRASHIVSVSGPDYGKRESSSDSPKGSVDPKALNEAAQKILAFKLGNLVYIQNNQPYAERLENGWSDQAPQGIYGLTFNFISQKYGG
ncbi:HK97 gp10 family phage protein [Acinetobacter baumannii]|nr:HK97 gp10 family phage protein [Acinetobacter baumannii]MDC4588131.1 HK97 gp10 family phage protein [Acinetobacter baumannii]MDC4599363.1 HK97 gp10 family phage protein [Acinetobacter baumannii]